MSEYDVVVVGGGPAGLSAALMLGRARRRVLLCDAGPRRNARALHLQNFVTRDGTPPEAFRGIGRAQLEPYASVAVRDLGVEEIGGVCGAFRVRLSDGSSVVVRRVLLCTGMIDELPPLEGFAEAWGRSIFVCPYCHAWEVQDRPFGVLAHAPEMLVLASLLRCWTASVVVFTQGLSVPEDARARLEGQGIAIEARPLRRLEVDAAGQLRGASFLEGPSCALEVLFARPPQRQVPLVQRLGLALDPMGYVQVQEPHRETSVPGIYAAGDLASPMQAAIGAAAAGVFAAGALNHALALEPSA